jgi:hypothetical protein
MNKKLEQEMQEKAQTEMDGDGSLLMLIILIKLQTKMASERGTYMVSK